GGVGRARRCSWSFFRECPVGIQRRIHLHELTADVHDRLRKTHEKMEDPHECRCAHRALCSSSSACHCCWVLGSDWRCPGFSSSALLGVLHTKSAASVRNIASVRIMTEVAAKTGAGPATMVAIELYFPQHQRIFTDSFASSVLPIGARA